MFLTDAGSVEYEIKSKLELIKERQYKFVKYQFSIDF